MQGAKSASLKCGKNCGDAPRNADTQMHLAQEQLHAPRRGPISFTEAAISTIAGN